jgi:short-chain fatty acids transporter
MNQQTKRSSEPGDLGAMQRLGASLADWSEKWFPDAYVFAGIAVAIVCAAALAIGRSPAEISVDFGKSFWNLIPFTMQMAFVVIGGYIVAVSAPVRRVIDVLARFPKPPKVAVAYVACLATRPSSDCFYRPAAESGSSKHPTCWKRQTSCT